MNNGGPLSSGSFILHLHQKVKLRPILFIPAIIWFIITTVLLVLPGPDIPTISFLDIIYFDKWVHAGLFGGLTLLFSYPFIRASKATKKLLIYIAILCALYGVAMEYVQKYIAIDRDFDYFDMLADAVGCLISYWLCLFIKKKLNDKAEVNLKNKPL